MRPSAIRDSPLPCDSRSPVIFSSTPCPALPSSPAVASSRPESGTPGDAGPGRQIGQFGGDLAARQQRLAIDAKIGVDDAARGFQQQIRGSPPLSHRRHRPPATGCRPARRRESCRRSRRAAASRRPFSHRAAVGRARPCRPASRARRAGRCRRGWPTGPSTVTAAAIRPATGIPSAAAARRRSRISASSLPARVAGPGPGSKRPLAPTVISSPVTARRSRRTMPLRSRSAEPAIATELPASAFTAGPRYRGLQREPSILASMRSAALLLRRHIEASAGRRSCVRQARRTRRARRRPDASFRRSHLPRSAILPVPAISIPAPRAVKSLSSTRLKSGLALADSDQRRSRPRSRGTPSGRAMPRSSPSAAISSRAAGSAGLALHDDRRLRPSLRRSRAADTERFAAGLDPDPRPVLGARHRRAQRRRTAAPLSPRARSPRRDRKD